MRPVRTARPVRALPRCRTYLIARSFPRGSPPAARPQRGSRPIPPAPHEPATPLGLGSIRTTLFHHFGHEAIPKVKKFVKVMVAKLRYDGKLLDDDVEAEHWHAADPEQGHDVHGVEEVYTGNASASASAAAAPAARRPQNGVLISGCQTDETSADATTPDGVSYGALSNTIQSILAGNDHADIGEAKVWLRPCQELVIRNMQQPGLYCSDEHAKLLFIC
ncbi:unnamed protein product [Urochloa humidicola]